MNAIRCRSGWPASPSWPLFGVLAFQAQNLPFFNGGGKIYRADFTEAANLIKTNEVRVAGVKVGTVTSVGLEGNHVLVKFRVRDGVSLGSQTKASIRIKTLVGAEYLALDPEGSGKLDPKTAIPVSRTTPPFDVIPAFQDLATTVNKIDTSQLTKALNVLSSDFSDTAPNVKQTLSGLSRLSNTIASRDQQLQTLLAHAKGVTGVLAGRDTELQQLLVSTDQVLQVLNERHEVISQLLTNTSALATQLTGSGRRQPGGNQPGAHASEDRHRHPECQPGVDLSHAAARRTVRAGLQQHHRQWQVVRHLRRQPRTVRRRRCSFPRACSAGPQASTDCWRASDGRRCRSTSSPRRRWSSPCSCSSRSSPS